MKTHTLKCWTELQLMKTAGIIEVAVRNPSVADYMAHWEGRAEAAEALLKALIDDLEMRAVTLPNGTKQVAVSDGVYHRALAALKEKP